ncbi:MAG TPA: 2-amino-4-hydroxy-6-hydroxymethyldihydropteridine diphosphokinase [Candidatus Acidoferrum sp.]|nr:2-amino-4-hydroxy-6-hydroxymethyldihydropteridine diphosphokinase [Candidatus Acidoferrum sp.]
MATVYLALGSNIGDREKNLREAIRLLREAGLQITKISSFYETEPVDYLDQPWFLNGALEAQTEFPPTQLLTSLRAIESQMGSKKAFVKGPRLIDLDILLYGDATIKTPELQVPHPRMLQRNFVLVPLAEIAPTIRHPGWSAPAAELLAHSSDNSQVRKFIPKNPSA